MPWRIFMYLSLAIPLLGKDSKASRVMPFKPFGLGPIGFQHRP